MLGSGGREHALGWKLAQSPLLDKLYAAPGNPGLATVAERVPLNLEDHDAIIDFCVRNSIDLVVVGPEAPLVNGLADALRAVHILVFGPGKAAARLEGSKGFTKDLCNRAAIPTARYARVSNREGALAALPEFGLPVVIKADGLAAGKGVTIAETIVEAEDALDAIFADDADDAEAVIEEFLTGEEVSLFLLTDGTSFVPFGSAQDHKRVGDGDIGPNTGGMGAYSPAPVLTPELEQRAIDEIIRPTIETLAADGHPYSGVLYAGLMLTADGPRLIEYNCRFGDPECQVLMMRLDGDLLAIIAAVAKGELKSIAVPRFSDNFALTVVMAAKGYPTQPQAGGAVERLEAAEATGATVFHAGTRQSGNELIASGGRVLAVTAVARTLGEARDKVYAAIDQIDFTTGFCRTDIGWREIEREMHNQ